MILSLVPPRVTEFEDEGLVGDKDPHRFKRHTEGVPMATETNVEWKEGDEFNRGVGLRKDCWDTEQTPLGVPAEGQLEI